MGFRQKWRRCLEEWRKHHEEEARLQDLHAFLLKALGERFLALGGTALVIPVRVEAMTLEVWRRNAQDAAWSDMARKVAAIFAEVRQGSQVEVMEYAFLQPSNGMLILEARLPRGTAYFQFRE